MENEKVLTAMRITEKRPGHAARTREEKTEAATARVAAAAPSLPTVEGFGKRGGLPRTKPELIKLATDLGLEADGTVEQLKSRVREFVDMLPLLVPTRLALRPARTLHHRHHRRWPCRRQACRECR